MESKHPLTVATQRLFGARKWALISAAAFLFVTMIAGRNVLAALTQLVLIGGFAIATLVTWHYIYRITRSLHGTVFAIGHLAISVLLTPVFLIGLILMPLLVRGDVERLS